MSDQNGFNELCSTVNRVLKVIITLVKIAAAIAVVLTLAWAGLLIYEACHPDRPAPSQSQSFVAPQAPSQESQEDLAAEYARQHPTKPSAGIRTTEQVQAKCTDEIMKTTPAQVEQVQAMDREKLIEWLNEDRALYPAASCTDEGLKLKARLTERGKQS
jgi:hypothetical protein